MLRRSNLVLGQECNDPEHREGDQDVGGVQQTADQNGIHHEAGGREERKASQVPKVPISETGAVPIPNQEKQQDGKGHHRKQGGYDGQCRDLEAVHVGTVPVGCCQVKGLDCASLLEVWELVIVDVSELRQVGRALPPVFSTLLPHYPKCAQIEPRLIESHGQKYGYSPGFLKEWLENEEVRECRSGRTFRGLLSMDLLRVSGVDTKYLVGKGRDYVRDLISRHGLPLPNNSVVTERRRGGPPVVYVVDDTAIERSEHWRDLAAATASFAEHLQLSSRGLSAPERARLQWDLLKSVAHSPDRDDVMMPSSAVFEQMAKKWRSWADSP